MSADNGIYILQTKDGYRVTHAQAIDNIYWHYTCCEFPNLLINQWRENCEEVCANCKKRNLPSEKRKEYSPDMLKVYFEDCKVFKKEIDAFNYAMQLYRDCGFCEYGIVVLDEWRNKEFPK